MITKVSSENHIASHALCQRREVRCRRTIRACWKLYVCVCRIIKGRPGNAIVEYARRAIESSNSDSRVSFLLIYIPFNLLSSAKCHVRAHSIFFSATPRGISHFLPLIRWRAIFFIYLLSVPLSRTRLYIHFYFFFS